MSIPTVTPDQLPVLATYDGIVVGNGTRLGRVDIDANALADAEGNALAAAASATEAALYDGAKVDTFAELAGITAAMLAVGEYIRVISTGHVYQRVASGGDPVQGVTLIQLKAINLKNLSQLVDLSLGDPAANRAALQAMLTTGGGVVHIPRGEIPIDQTVSIDYSTPSFVTSASNRVSIAGEASHATRLIHYGTGAAIERVGSDVPLNQGINGHDRISGMVIKPDPARTRVAGMIGIADTRKGYAQIQDVYAEKMDFGYYADGSFLIGMDDCTFNENNTGIRLRDNGSFSRNNAMHWRQVRAKRNLKWGINADAWGAGNTLIGLEIDRNGTQGDFNTGGMVLNLTTDNGAAAGAIIGAYCEINKGFADIVLNNTSANPVTITFDDCQFHRASATEFTINNIYGSSSGGGLLTINIGAGCVFYSDTANGYVPSAARPFWASDGNVVFNDFGCVFSETISQQKREVVPKELFGMVAANGTGVRTPPTITYTKPATGIYRVTTSTAFGLSINEYTIRAVCNDAAGGLSVQGIRRNSASQFDVITENAATGALADASFEWAVTRQ